MEIRNDFKELLEFLNKHKVEYLVVGGYALAFHGITSISGVSLKKADNSKVPGQYGWMPVCFIAREDFITNKKATGRKKDASDIEALGEQ
jgi:hypothetical protein